MGLVLTFLMILVSLLCSLVKVDSQNQHHMPNDRPRPTRAHNLHRAPYEGYDWDKVWAQFRSDQWNPKIG